MKETTKEIPSAKRTNKNQGFDIKRPTLIVKIVSPDKTDMQIVRDSLKTIHDKKCRHHELFAIHNS